MTVCCELECLILPVGTSHREHHVLRPFFHCAKTFCLCSGMCHKECNVQAPSMHCDSKIGGIPFIYGNSYEAYGPDFDIFCTISLRYYIVEPIILTDVVIYVAFVISIFLVRWWCEILPR